MKILLSAYACEPGKGSEPGVGWHWATELARLGHRVDVLTRANNRASIEAALARDPMPGLSFHYYDLPRWAMWWKRGRRNYHLYYSLWQRGAYRLARDLVKTRHYDLVHHLTFGIFRQPSLMGRLGLPFVLGPVGGGESIPKQLRGGYPLKRKATEFVRECGNRLALLNPAVRSMFRQASLILCKTEETLAYIPAGCREQARVQCEIGLDPGVIAGTPEPPVAPASFLYAGALIYWKGMHLALQALAALRIQRPDATLTVIGGGEDEQWLRNCASHLGVLDSVRWLGQLPQRDMWAQYRRHTAFIFPSLHDSSGNVIFEALSQAIPVICLNTGGPGSILPETCGIKVPVKNRTQAQVIAGLAEAMQLYIDYPQLREQAAQRALEAARSRLWSDTVSTAYSLIEQTLRLSVQV